MFFSKKHKSKGKEKHKPLVVEENSKFQPLQINLRNASVLALLKKEYTNSKQNSLISTTDSFVSVSTTNSIDSSVASTMRLPSFPDLLSSKDNGHLDLLKGLNHDDDIESALGMALDEHSSDLSEKVDLQKNASHFDRSPELQTKKSVQFTNVDIVSHNFVKQSRESNQSMSTVASGDEFSESEEELQFTDENTSSQDIWAISRTTQTEFKINEDTDNLSNEELREALRLVKEENEDMNSRLHALVDENATFVKNNNSIRLQLEEVSTHQEIITGEYSMLKADYKALQSHISDTRKQLQQSHKKTRELEKLSKKAINRIKELEGEKKFLNMQVEWLRGKMVQASVGERDNSDDNSSFSSSVSSLNLEKQSSSKPKKKRSKGRENEGWETEV